MKIITIEEHFESEVITNEINKVTGNLVSGQVSPEMFQYMQRNFLQQRKCKIQKNV